MLRRAMLGLAVFVILALPVPAQDRSAVERQFRVWLEKTVWPRAREAGVSADTFRTAFAGVTLNWDLPDLVPPGAQAQTPKRQRQAEFGAPARYFSRGAIDAATATGRRMAARHATTLARVEQAKKWHIAGEDWTPDSGELTPSLKLKRRVVFERYAEQIEAMYAD